MDSFDTAILGLGFTGLPAAVAAAQAGMRVVGVDSSTDRVACVAAAAPGCGLTTVSEIDVARQLANGMLSIRPVEELPLARAYVLCVPTPPGPDGGADLGPLLRAAGTVAARLRRNDLVLVQSTCPPGVVERVLAPRLAFVSGLQPGQGFALAHSPVRIMPGAGSPDLCSAPRVVGGLTRQCRERAAQFLQRFTADLVPVGSVLAAELTKVFENTFRLVNISLVNELAAVCAELRLDPAEVLHAAGTKPVGFLGHEPGPGAGGSCVPVAAAFFAATARRQGLAAAVVEAAVSLNDAMPARTIHLVRRVLAANGQPPLERRRILVVGVTYKPDVAHATNSPAVRVLEQLRLDAEIAYHDPHVPELVLSDGEVLRSRPMEPGVADVVLLLTRHDAMPSGRLHRLGVPVVDCTSGIPRLLPTPRDLAG